MQKISILLYRVFVKTTTLLIRAHSDGRGGGGGVRGQINGVLLNKVSYNESCKTFVERNGQKGKETFAPCFH